MIVMVGIVCFVAGFIYAGFILRPRPSRLSIKEALRKK